MKLLVVIGSLRAASFSRKIGKAVGSLAPDGVQVETTDGGALPLTWFVNGSPLRAGAHRRNAFWRPDGRGFVRLTVMDRSGRTDSVVVRVDRAE